MKSAAGKYIISTALYAISMVTSGIFIGRLPIYCSLYANGILLPWELNHLFGQGPAAAPGCHRVLLGVLLFPDAPGLGPDLTPCGARREKGRS